jgi:dihydrolipoamide dehydrogenase
MDKHVVIIGAGPGGYVAAIRAAKNGIKTTLVESGPLGGTCLNAGCIPTKALAASATLLRKIRDGASLGVKAEGISVDFPAVNAHKDSVKERLGKGIEALLKKNGVNLILGRAEFKSSNAVKVTGGAGISEIEFSHAIIATGSSAAKPKFIPFDGERVLTAEEMLSLREIPKRLLIIGGGVIGCEFASIYSAFGSAVHVVEMLPRILSTLDEDLAKELARAFKKSKIAVSANAKVEKIERRGDIVYSTLPAGKTVEADIALVAIGRSPNSASLGLENAGVKTDSRGYITVDDSCRTNVPNIYAIGDVTGKWFLAHAASAQGLYAADHIAGQDRRVNWNAIPACVFTNPELASVGLSEADARAKGHDVKCGMFQMRMLGKAQAIDEISGFVKIVGNSKTGMLLGMHVAGADASTIIHEGAIALSLGAKVSDIAHAIHAHPTLSEAAMEAAEDFLGGAIHG